MIERIEIGLSAQTLNFDYLTRAKEYADYLGVVGIVFLKDDGSLKIVAEGEEESLRELAGRIEEDHVLHHVENFYALLKAATGEFDSFSIITNDK
jgi:acylphosphatase